MKEQLNLFEELDNVVTESDNIIPFHTEGKEVTKTEKNNNDLLSSEIPCYQSQFINKSYKSLNDLFSGFNSIKIITFSYSLNFLDSIVGLFDESQIIIGANHIAKKEAKDLVSAIMSIHDNSIEIIKKHQQIVEMIKNGTCSIRTPNFIVDHRKIFLLKSDSGRTRTIIATANASKSAWIGQHMEHYEYDDSLEKYELLENEFFTMWNDSTDISSGDLIKITDKNIESKFIKKIKKHEQIAIVTPAKTEEDIERTRFIHQVDKDAEKNMEYLKGANLKDKGGLIQLTANVVKKIENNIIKFHKKQKITFKEELSPEYIIDYDKETITFGGQNLLEQPSEKAVKRSIQAYLNIMDSYNDDKFIGDLEQHKMTHFRVLVLVFSSLFNSNLRYEAFLNGKGWNALPLYVVLSSPQSNSGKTFMATTISKMMTGEKIPKLEGDRTTIQTLREFVAQEKLLSPLIVDEVNATKFTHIKNLIKNSDSEIALTITKQPMMIFTSNDVQPDDSIRKRSTFFKYSAKLRSDVDEVQMKTIGDNLQNQLTIDLFKEYLIRIFPIVKKIINELDKKQDYGYYPELVDISSKTIISILKDYGFNVPSYMKELTWHKDYSTNSQPILDNVFNEIIEEFRKVPEIFIIEKEFIKIITKGNHKTLEGWKKLLPTECSPKIYSSRENDILTINRIEFEKRSGFKFKKSFFSRFKR